MIWLVLGMVALQVRVLLLLWKVENRLDELGLELDDGVRHVKGIHKKIVMAKLLTLPRRKRSVGGVRRTA